MHCVVIDIVITILKYSVFAHLSYWHQTYQVVPATDVYRGYKLRLVTSHFMSTLGTSDLTSHHTESAAIKIKP